MIYLFIVLIFQEDFLDLSVAIAAGAGLQDVLHGNYVEMESLSGNNQYRCEACQKLVDAKKVVVWDNYSYSSISVLKSEPMLINHVIQASFPLLTVALFKSVNVNVGLSVEVGFGIRIIRCVTCRMFTICNSHCGKVMFLQAYVKNSVHRGVYTP